MLQYGYYVIPQFHLGAYLGGLLGQVPPPETSPKYGVGLDLVGRPRRREDDRSEEEPGHEVTKKAASALRSGHSRVSTEHHGHRGMIAYAIRRVLLMIPTLFAIMVVNFFIVQAAPGGPVQQMIAKLRGNTDLRHRAGQRRSATRSSCDRQRRQYRGARGLDPAFIKRAATSNTASTSRPSSASC